MAQKRRSAKSSSPLDAIQRELNEKQRQVDAKMKALNAFVEEAPRIRDEAQKRRRDELVAESMRGGRRLDAPAAIERRGDVFISTPSKPRRSLKAEKRHARLKFFVLFLLLLLVLSLVYKALP